MCDFRPSWTAKRSDAWPPWHDPVEAKARGGGGDWEVGEQLGRGMQTVPQPVCQPAGSIVWQTVLFVFVLQTTSAQTYQSAIKIYSYRHTSPRCGENGYKASIPTRQLRWRFEFTSEYKYRQEKNSINTKIYPNINANRSRRRSRVGVFREGKIPASLTRLQLRATRPTWAKRGSMMPWLMLILLYLQA